ncbi:hypothetical protein E2C01_016420 [Portunus trituberculatus]|uniref:Uncharacterized protein n=1 Tax=Portunus trituberculatus TaxID=210409 RepID=A0A5B7DR20_PORTR|nr:hypothetical protein [Portunus trituberculatus]
MERVCVAPCQASPCSCRSHHHHAALRLRTADWTNAPPPPGTRNSTRPVKVTLSHGLMGFGGSSTESLSASQPFAPRRERGGTKGRQMAGWQVGIVGWNGRPGGGRRG